MEDLMERFFGTDAGTPFVEEEFALAVNLAETDSQLEVTVDLPGIKPEEVKVELKNGDLWITGERKEEKEEKGKQYRRIERRYGSFCRVMTLPSPVDESKVNAEYHDGVLRISLPKSEKVKPKRIEVKT
jgi:HSP20 family protein